MLTHDKHTPSKSPLGHYLTTTEAAERSGMSQVHIRLLIRKGKLRGLKPAPRLWLVEIESLDEYLAVEHKSGPKPKTKPTA